MATCGEDYGCLYDTGQTGNVLLGLSTRNIRENNQRIRGNLGKIIIIIIIIILAHVLYTCSLGTCKQVVNIINCIVLNHIHELCIISISSLLKLFYYSDLNEFF